MDINKRRSVENQRKEGALHEDIMKAINELQEFRHRCQEYVLKHLFYLPACVFEEQIHPEMYISYIMFY